MDIWQQLNTQFSQQFGPKNDSLPWDDECPECGLIDGSCEHEADFFADVRHEDLPGFQLGDDEE